MTVIDDLLRRWKLVLDGPEMRTATSLLVPVRFRGGPAMLKVSTVEEERCGMRQMVWWNGGGAAAALAFEDGALLMDRAPDPRGLEPWVRRGDDAAATRVLCEVAARLHATRDTPPPPLEPLDLRFGALRERASSHASSDRDAFYELAWSVAADLLASPRDVTALHGDLHHGNVLDFGSGRWRAIDPKGVIGERAFDYANLFCNPSMDIATASGRVGALADDVSGHARVDRSRLLAWVVAWCGLSAAWTEQEGGDAAGAVAVGRIADRIRAR